MHPMNHMGRMLLHDLVKPLVRLLQVLTVSLDRVRVTTRFMLPTASALLSHPTNLSKIQTLYLAPPQVVKASSWQEAFA